MLEDITDRRPICVVWYPPGHLRIFGIRPEVLLPPAALALVSWFSLWMQGSYY